MSRLLYGVRFPDRRGDRPMPNEVIARKVARHVGGTVLVRSLTLTDWEVRWRTGVEVES